MLTEMARNRKRKTNRETVPSARMKEAVLEVVEKKRSIKSVSSFYDIKRTTLRRYIIKYGKADDKEGMRFMPKYNARQVFTAEQEHLLAEYFITSARFNYGHSPVTARRLAYEFAMENGIDMPYIWVRDCSAGEEWLTGFLKRHRDLSVRQPEATSLARGTAFNHHNVNAFFDKLDDLYNRYRYGPESVYNCDETGLTTVQRPVKVIAAKGSKQVGAVTSQERGQLVTVCCTVNALGNTIPPFMIFPRVIFKTHMLAGAPPGTTGTAYPSGWMTCENFTRYLKHFIHHAKCSTESPVLLLLDNHESHISVEAISMCKENGVSVLTIPPHCSHRLQLLDVAVYGPLKTHYNNACTSWLHTNAATPMTIFSVAQCFGEAYPLSCSPRNIMSGFRATGIWPFNRDVFNDADFLAANVTDREYMPTDQPSTSSAGAGQSSTSGADAAEQSTSDAGQSLSSGARAADPSTSDAGAGQSSTSVADQPSTFVIDLAPSLAHPPVDGLQVIAVELCI